MIICNRYIYYDWFRRHFASVGRPQIKHDKLALLGTRLRQLRERSNVSQRQIELITGMDQAHLSRLEAGRVNVSINYIFIIADFFGLDDYELLNFGHPLPAREVLEKNIQRYLTRKNISGTKFFKSGLSAFLEEKVIPTKFLSTPKYTREIADFIKKEFEGDFTSSALSQALTVFRKKGLIEKIPTNSKSKFQYRKK